VSIPDPTTLYEEYRRELAEFVELVRTGKAFSDRAAAERLAVRLVGALTHLHMRHRVDERGRCSTCRSVARAWWPWPKRITCTVYSALGASLRQPERFVLAVITDYAAAVRGRS
jgi:hypothetical protein